MPFVKSNWACEPALEEDGAFEFGRAFKLQGLSLQRGSQTRPCFLHVSSEAECMVRSLTLIASAEVEVLDVFALLGSLESMDYRKLGSVQGSPMEGGRVFFNINTAQFPSMWQLQLKFSSRAPTVVIHELSVQVDKTAGGSGGLSSLASAPASALASASSKPLGVTSDAALFQTVNSTSMRSTGTRALGATGDLDATNSSLNLSRSRSRAATATAGPAMSRLAASSRLDTSASASAVTRPSTTTTTTALASMGTRSSAAAASASSDLARRGANTSATLAAAGPTSAETAAVASVLNAVCEKMVGVMSEKTKTYLAKAGKRTERRVLDKMAKLEERIERFDDVLKHTTASSSELEAALLALNRDMVSPRTPVATA